MSDIAPVKKTNFRRKQKVDSGSEEYIFSYSGKDAELFSNVSFKVENN